MYRFWCNFVIILMWLIDVADSRLLVWIGRVAGLSLYYGGVIGDMVDGTITYMIVVARGRCWWRDRGIIVVIAIVIVSTIIVIVDIRINGYLWKVLPLVVITPRMILIIHYHLLCTVIIIHWWQQVLSIKWVHSPFTITTIICTTILVFTTTITTIIYSSIVTHT